MKNLFTLTFLLGLLVAGCAPKEVQTVTPAKKPAPVAAFSWKSLGQGKIQFTSSSSNAEKHQWSFGENTTTSEEVEPVYTYSQNGQYIATLTVSNSTSLASASQAITVTSFAAPKLDFTATESTGGQVTIKNQSSGATTYSWNFGNGQTSTLSDPPAVTYDENKTYTISLTGSGSGGIVTLQKTVTVTTAKPKVTSFAAAIDDQKLVAYLPGVWGGTIQGQGYKYDTYVYTFNPSNNTLTYDNFYNNYQYILSPDSRTLTYTFGIADKVISVDESFSGRRVKHARFEIVSEDEMRFFRILETANTYSELSPFIVTKVSNVEKAITEVVRAPNVLSILQGVWEQSSYSIYNDIAFDFSAGRNYYNYHSTFNGAKSIVKTEYKIDSDGVMSYRTWNSRTDPGWKKYKLRVVSDKAMELYQIDASTGRVSTTAEYNLKKRG